MPARTHRAIVATDVPGCREIARAGDNALLVPPKAPEALAARTHADTVAERDLDNAEAQFRMAEARTVEASQRLELLRRHKISGSVHNWQDRRRDVYVVRYNDGDSSVDRMPRPTIGRNAKPAIGSRPRSSRR